MYMNIIPRIFNFFKEKYDLNNNNYNLQKSASFWKLDKQHFIYNHTSI
jgi:hypothetical protein